MSEPEKKKRGRKKKVNIENIQISIETKEPNVKNEVVVKKRGRKPKGGKIISKEENFSETNNSVQNIILHLKCSLADLVNDSNELNSSCFSYDPTVPPEIQSFEIQNKNKFSNYEDEHNNIKYAYTNDNSISINENINSTNINNTEDVKIKEINSKLKDLKINLYKNTLKDKKSACFWCTYEFDNPPCYIPKYDMDQEIFGYGSFCRPECAAAYLMKENIDDSSKFERYNILNSIYSKVYNYKKNIKPAPNPYYILDKFFGNLSIQEYRKLLNSEHLLLVVDKPMTRILPELFEDNDNFILNIYSSDDNKAPVSSSNSIYKVKRKSESKETTSKKNIIQDTFGLTK